MKHKMILLLATLLLSFLGIESMLRLLSARMNLDEPLTVSPFSYDLAYGYELKPKARLTFRDEHGWRFYSTMNNEGFRGPARSIPKPVGTFRILALGDSVVESMSVREPDMWETRLETILNAAAPPSVHVEVLNLGIGGYVAWQAVYRFIHHGLKYQPDLVIVLVGWNDFVYSTLPIWKPNLELSEIEKAYAPIEAEHLKFDFWSRLKRAMSHFSYAYRWLSHYRNSLLTRPQEDNVIARHLRDSGAPFNEKALQLYQENLERLYQRAHAAGTRMALLTWPTILAPKVLNDPSIDHRLLTTFTHFPLSTGELWNGYNRYQEAQRDFVRKHPDVLLIDAAKEWSASTQTERLQDFVDMAHLTVVGNRRLAETVAAHVKFP